MDWCRVTRHQMIAALMSRSSRVVDAGQEGARRPVIRRVVEPSLETTVSLCVSESMPLSDPALAVRDLLVGLVGELVAGERCVGVRAPDVSAHRATRA